MKKKRLVAAKLTSVNADQRREKLQAFLEIVKNIDGQSTAMQDIAEGSIDMCLDENIDQDDRDMAFNTLLSIAFPE